MKKKPPTKAERQHMARVQSIGCIACASMGIQQVPAEIHHILDCGRRVSHYAVLPLCAGHHRRNDDKHELGPARHYNKTRFEERFGEEQKLLEFTMRCVRALEAMTV